jgi:2-polyprenyl-6-methoxyphenol hydroxylase-like FAD-dependent oxidoreductase
MTSYDVVIVGARPAGASLAARLGKRGRSVLLLDRAKFPSLPSVPSSPALHAGAMKILDEMGVPESSYAHSGAKMRTFAVQVGSHFSTVIPMYEAWGRDYAYGIDRQLFDDVLWKHAGTFPSVTRREEFAVTDLVQENGQVAGVIGAAGDGALETIRARVVVGADGRFSLVARKVSAEVVEENAKFLATVYYADWENVAPLFDGDEGAHVFTTARGLDVPMFRMPGGRMNVNLHIRADRVDIQGDADTYYHETLRSHPEVWRRLEGARRVSPIFGIKKIGNGYRKASGPGWVLTGDALHYKDPVDGQGIYDALLETRELDPLLDQFLDGKLAWDEAMRRYWEAVQAGTHAMFEQTQLRLQRELYSEPPALVMKTMMRWLLTDEAYQKRFIHYLTRYLPDDRLMTPGVMAGAIVRGVGRDISRLWRRKR